MRTIIFAAAFSCLATQSWAVSPYEEVKDWTVDRFYSELSLFARWDILAPKVEPTGIDRTDFLACLRVWQMRPDTRTAPLKRAVEDCLATFGGAK